MMKTSTMKELLLVQLRAAGRLRMPLGTTSRQRLRWMLRAFKCVGLLPSTKPSLLWLL
ncbi:hypothetical protein CHLRE_06g254300v5 [Chlamydomonas reinhardtii]|uniref:Uncharacterized protein n=1 Tax=Chlamydomonas reinhardtii TaxID=3055 RepID=A0A2K3DM76_CHLRE|nr:uncharacterized protein CHLRE_06g254300v5 [Chlamydomonas reinhardtii]PNW81646.1 hypothetical protein CHLRE_06g254300v5 [Chlamydomonas reinhardtii]